MANDISSSTIRALLVPDLRLGFDALSPGASTYEQAGPLPGVPEATGDTEMVLESTGEQVASKQLRIKAIQAGQPTPNGGAFAWKYEADSLWRGWDGPFSISYFEQVDYSTTSLRWKHPHAITLSDGSIVVVSLKSNRYITSVVRNPSTGAWVETTIYDRGTGGTQQAWPTVAVLPNGRLLCFFWIEDTTTATAQIRMHYSDDNAATWTVGSKTCLTAALTSIATNLDVHTLRVAYLNGQLLLVAQIEDATLADRSDVLYQWASNDLGCSFVLIDQWEGVDDDSWAYRPSLFAYNGQFVLHYLTQDTTTTGNIVPKQRTIASAYQLLSAAPATLATEDGIAMTWGDIAGAAPKYFTSGECASWVDEDGAFYIAGRNHAAGALAECHVVRSVDGGATWSHPGKSSVYASRAAFWSGHDAATYPQDITGTSQGGRGVLVHGFASTPDTHGDSMAATYLGGYTTITLPTLYSFPSAIEQIAWERTWVGFDLPENTGGVWTAVDAGAPTVALSSTGVVITAGVAESRTWTLTTAPTSTLAQGMVALVDVKVTSGTFESLLTSAVAGPHQYEIGVYVTTTSIRLRDMVAGADIVTVATTAGAAGVQILMAVGNANGAFGSTGKGAAWYCATGDGDREFIPVGSSTTLHEGGSTANQWQWGVAAGSAADVVIRQACYTYGAYAGQQLYNGQSNPSDLQGRYFSVLPEWVDGGTKINAVDGPCVYGDQWEINTRYEFPIDNIFPENAPSPDRGWRSTSTAAQTIVLTYDSVLDERSPSLEPVMGLALFNVNFPVFFLEGDTGGGTWEEIAEVHTYEGQDALKFTRMGDTVIPRTDTPHGADEWFTYDTLAGSYFQMYLGGMGGYEQIRKIRTNSEGAFSDGNTKHARIQLLDVDSGDSSGSGLPVGAVWSKDVVVLCNNSSRYTRLRIRIPSQDTAEGYFTIGTMILGHVVTFAWQYSRGRALTTTANVSLATSRSGTRRARRQGASRRSVEFAWTDGVDVTAATSSPPVPDYVTGYDASTMPVGAPSDTPYTVAGLAEQLSGALYPMVYLPGFTRAEDEDTPIVIVNRNRFLLCRLVSTVRLESRLGGEWGSPGELFNVATMTLEGEV